MMEHADKYIIDGFRSFNPAITKEYFYGYCRRAYNIYDYKYQLRNKTGLDFYSLAHEYYKVKTFGHPSGEFHLLWLIQ